MDYRVYLLDQKFSIRAAENFAARDDSEAVEVASALHDACSDIFVSCELWRGSSLVAKLPRASADGHNGTDHSRSISSDIRLLLPVRQENVLALEDRLQRSFACVRESHRLLRTYRELTGNELSADGK